MVAIGGADPSFLLWPAKPSLLAHDAVNFLVIDQSAFAFELLGYTAISIPGKVQKNLLHTLNQRLVRSFFLRLVVVTASGKIHQFTPPFNVFDEGAVFGNELSFF